MSVIAFRKAFTRFYLRHGFQNTVIVVKTALRNLAFANRFANGAARVSIVLAVAVFTLAEVIVKFDKTIEDLFRFKMPEAKLAHAGRVNHVAAVREVIEAGGGGGVLAKSGIIGDIVGQDLILQAEQGVKQARLADA